MCAKGTVLSCLSICLSGTYFAQLFQRNKGTILCSCSLHCVKTFYKIFVLHDMHMILESLESDFKCALIDTKISQIACWEHIEPKTQYIAMA